MAMRIEMVPVENVVDAYSGIHLTDITQVISSNLSKSELERYAKVVFKVGNRETLNRKDLVLMDKIDAITYQHRGVCLKDSKVTKARLKACKKHSMQFIDRDHLVDHMNSMLPNDEIQVKRPNLTINLAELFLERFGDDLPEKMFKIANKLGLQQDFDLQDLQFISEMEALANSEARSSLIDEQLWLAIDKSCKKLGVYFENLQKAVLH